MQKVLQMAEGIIVGERPNFQLVAGESKKRSGSCHDGKFGCILAAVWL